MPRRIITEENHRSQRRRKTGASHSIPHENIPTQKRLYRAMGKMIQ